MARISQAQYDALIAKIRAMEQDLWYARNTVIELIPEELQDILETYRHCNTPDDTPRWQGAMADAVIAYAKPLPDLHPMIGTRARCPLCRKSSQSPYTDGYALPEGLRRHLLGDGGSHLCHVVQAAVGLAEHYWDDEFGPRGSAKRDQFEREIVARKKKEVLFRTAPYSEPQLLNSSRRFQAATRDSDGIKWAEGRLVEMGFQIETSMRVRSYTREHGNAVVFADPTRKGIISFITLLKPPPIANGFCIRPPVPVSHFSMRDTRKHGLREACDKAIVEAVRELHQPPRLVAGPRASH